VSRVYTKDPTKHWSNLGYVKKKKCERCSSKKQLCVHHKDRDRKNNKPDNLETICRLCHIEEHREEVAEAQRRSEVNKRRGAAIHKAAQARPQREFPLIAAMARRTWAGPAGDKLRKHRKSKKFREETAAHMRRLMNDPAHIEKRRLMKEARRGGA
jgi:hypothetical protein